MVDEMDGSSESSQVDVAALARFLDEIETGSLYVVTEDSSDLPTRLCLAKACTSLGFAVMDARTFVGHIGLAGRLLQSPIG